MIIDFFANRGNLPIASPCTLAPYMPILDVIAGLATSREKVVGYGYRLYDSIGKGWSESATALAYLSFPSVYHPPFLIASFSLFF